MSHPAQTAGDPVQGTVTAALLRLQHARGWLSDADLRALAGRLGEPVSRLEEVVSFFPHFRRQPPPAAEVLVCRDMTCHLRGAADLIGDLGRRLAGTGAAVRGVSCLGRCDRAPAAVAGRPAADDREHLYLGRTAAQLAEVAVALADGGTATSLPVRPNEDADRPATAGPWAIDVYAGAPTYEAAKRVLRELRQADDLVAARGRLDLIPKLELAGLRGMGGAGAPAAKKWKDVRQAAGAVKYIVCNADESEPATFKDRELMLRAPWLIIEGVILAGLACGAARGYVYLRHEYPEQAAALRAAIAHAERERVCGADLGGTGLSFPVAVFVSPGGYICGEQSALIEAMEGKRAQPRNRPPELATNGLFDKPTLVNNVETFAWVPGIALNTVLDPDKAKQVNWYADQGRPDKDGKGRGMRFFSISGDVGRPGVYEVPGGAPLRELIDRAGGVVGGEGQLLAVAPSGPSGGFLPRRVTKGDRSIDVLDLELDIDEFRKWGLALGAGLVVYAAGTDVLAQAVNATEFYRNESCGKCVPCRVGSDKLVEIGHRLLAGAPADGARGAVRDLDRALEMTSICGLGQVVPKPLATYLKDFCPAPGGAHGRA